LVLDESFVIK
jgi:hypothetical protein